MDQWEEDNVKNMGNFIKEHGIDCDLRDVETADETTDEEQFQEFLDALKVRKEVAGKTEVTLFEHKIWGKEEARKGLLIPKAVGAASFPAHVLNPYKFVCALLEMSLKKGLNRRQIQLLLKCRRRGRERDGSFRLNEETSRLIMSFSRQTRTPKPSIPPSRNSPFQPEPR
jgi:glycine/D-amino acid oxidase-like deaminating enzyme